MEDINIPPPLYAIVSLDKSGDFIDLSHKIIEAKIGWIQLRNKDIVPPSEFKEFVNNLISLKNRISPSSKIIINDDPILAKEVKADGVHLGQSDMNPILAREILGPGPIIGLSTNNLSQAQEAPLHVLSYLACGPVFNSITKSGHADPIGIKGVAEITSQINFPFVAIGGITLANAESVFQAGTKSVAMVSELVSYKNQLQKVHKDLETFRKLA